MRLQYLLSLLLASLTAEAVLSIPAHRSQHEEPESMSGTIAQWRIHGSGLDRLRARNGKNITDEERMQTFQRVVSKVINVLGLVNGIYDRKIQLATIDRIMNINGVIQTLMLGYHPLQVKSWLEHTPDLAADMSTVSLAHWKSNPKLAQFVSLVDEHDKWLSMLSDAKTHSAGMEIWKKEWQEMDNIDQTSIFYRLSDTTTKVLGDHTGEELVADGVSPILYSRALEELAETNKEESPQQYDAWYSRQRERFETFVEAYRKKLDLPPRHPVLEMFANFKVHEGIAI